MTDDEKLASGWWRRDRLGRIVHNYWNRCALCGRFFSPKELDEGGGAVLDYTPDTSFSAEEIRYTCRCCADSREE